MKKEQKVSKIKAVIFDMDGVLIDAKEWHFEALNAALRVFGMEISRFEHLKSFDGLPTKDKLKMLSNAYFLPSSLHSLINKLKQKFTTEFIISRCKPNFAHEFALSRLKNEGFKLALASNSIKKTIVLMMEMSALSEYFDFYLSNEDVKISKPNPEIYIKAIKRLNLKPREVLILEDNFNGIKAARQSGANVLEIGDVSEVNYLNIKRAISKFEAILKEKK